MSSNSLRPKRSFPRVDYREIVRMGILKPSRKTMPSAKCQKLFRLEIIDKDARNKTVKVHYVGYDSSFDEWRTKSGIIDFE